MGQIIIPSHFCLIKIPMRVKRSFLPFQITVNEQRNYDGLNNSWKDSQKKGDEPICKSICWIYYLFLQKNDTDIFGHSIE